MIPLSAFIYRTRHSASSLVVMLLFEMFLTLVASAQTIETKEENLSPDRSVPAMSSPLELRKPNESRVWTFALAQQDIGRLRSTVVQHEPGKRLILETKLDLDYTRAGQERVLSASARTTFSTSGTYLADEISLTVDGNEGDLSWKRKANQLQFESDAGGRKVTELVALDSTVRVWEPHFVDQLELLLASISIRVGDSIIDSVFQPQGRTIANVRGDVPYFMWQETWKGKIDSVFIIRLEEPMRAQLYYTADRRLVRADFLDERLRIYQDIIVATNVPKAPSVGEAIWSKFARINFVTVGLALLLFFPLCIIGFLFARRGTEMHALLSRAGIIGIGCGLVLAILQPVVISLMIPALQRGGILIVSLLSALVLAVITVVLVALCQILFARLTKGASLEKLGWGIGLFGAHSLGVTSALIVLGQGKLQLFSSATLEQILLVLLLSMIGGLVTASGGVTSRQSFIWMLGGVLTITVWRMIPALMITTGVNPGALAAFYVVLIALWGGLIFISGRFQFLPAPGAKRKR